MANKLNGLYPFLETISITSKLIAIQFQPLLKTSATTAMDFLTL
jgi:hypothetical protein